MSLAAATQTVRTAVRRSRLVRGFCFLAMTSLLSACEPSASNAEIRLWTDSYVIRIVSDPQLPIAEELTRYRITVQDKESNQPVDGGEGRIFATSRDGAQTHDGFVKGDQVGVYYASVRFPFSGEWAMGVQFRRDAASVLERTNDWLQEVKVAPPLGSRPQDTLKPASPVSPAADSVPAADTSSSTP